MTIFYICLCLQANCDFCSFKLLELFLTLTCLLYLNSSTTERPCSAWYRSEVINFLNVCLYWNAPWAMLCNRGTVCLQISLRRFSLLSLPGWLFNILALFLLAKQLHTSYNSLHQNLNPISLLLLYAASHHTLYNSFNCRSFIHKAANISTCRHRILHNSCQKNLKIISVRLQWYLLRPLFQNKVQTRSPLNWGSKWFLHLTNLKIKTTPSVPIPTQFCIDLIPNFMPFTVTLANTLWFPMKS